MNNIEATKSTYKPTEFMGSPYTHDMRVKKSRATHGKTGKNANSPYWMYKLIVSANERKFPQPSENTVHPDSYFLVIKNLEYRLENAGITIPELVERQPNTDIEKQMMLMKSLSADLDCGIDSRNSTTPIDAQVDRQILLRKGHELPAGVADARTAAASLFRQEIGMTFEGVDEYLDGLTRGPLISESTEESIVERILAQLGQENQSLPNNYQTFLREMIPLVFDMGSTTGNSVHAETQTFLDLVDWMKFLRRLEQITDPEQQKIAAQIVFEVLREQTSLFRSQNKDEKRFETIVSISGTHLMYLMVNGGRQGIVCQPTAAGSTVQSAAQGKPLGGGVGKCAQMPAGNEAATNTLINIVPNRKENGQALSYVEYRMLQINTLVAGLEQSLTVTTENEIPDYTHVIAIPAKCGLIYKETEELISYFGLIKLATSNLLSAEQKIVVETFLARNGRLLLVIDSAQERWLVNPARILEVCEDNGIASIWMSTVSKSIGAAKLAGLHYCNDQAIEILGNRIALATEPEIRNILRYYGIGFLPEAIATAVLQRLKELGINETFEANFTLPAKILSVAARLNEYRSQKEDSLQTSVDWLRNRAIRTLNKHPQIELIDNNHPDAFPSMILSLRIKDRTGKSFNSNQLKRLRAMMRAGAGWQEDRFTIDDSKVFTGNPFDDITAKPIIDEKTGSLLNVEVSKVKHDAFLRFGPKIELLLIIKKLQTKKEQLEAKQNLSAQESEQLKTIETKLDIVLMLWEENFNRLKNVVENYYQLAVLLYEDEAQKISKMSSVDQAIYLKFGKVLSKDDVMALKSDEIELLNQILLAFNPSELLIWAIALDPKNIYATTSGQPHSKFFLRLWTSECQNHDIRNRVIFVDTLQNFPEVLKFMDDAKKALGFELTTITSSLADELSQLFAYPREKFEYWKSHQSDLPEEMRETMGTLCCYLRKVLPLMLWCGEQNSAPVIVDSLNGKRVNDKVVRKMATHIKIHPFVTQNPGWEDATKQAMDEKFSQNPLQHQFADDASIGCAPCTNEHGKDRESCRGTRGGKPFECGMHLDRPGNIVGDLIEYKELFVKYILVYKESMTSAGLKEVIAKSNQIFDKYIAQISEKIVAVAGAKNSQTV